MQIEEALLSETSNFR